MRSPEFLKLLKKEILPHFPDYFLFKDMLIHKSSNEILKFINFETLSFLYFSFLFNLYLYFKDIL